MYSDRSEPPVKEMVSEVFHKCLHRSDFQLDPDEMAMLRGSYLNLLITADVLLHSHFLEHLVCDRNQLNLGLTENAQRLKRRLGNVCQYVSIKQLTLFVK